MDEMVRELTGALERGAGRGTAQPRSSESSPARSTSTRCSTRVLETAGAIPGADAALVTLTPSRRRTADRRHAGALRRGGRAPVRARPPGRPRSAGDLDLVRVRAARRSRRPKTRSGPGSPSRCRARRRPLGLITIFTREHGHRFGEEETRELEELAMRAGPAIENARRFREARQLADLDALTGPPQPALLPRDARARGRPRAPLPAEPGARRSSTSTTSRRSTTASGTSRATASSPRRRSASATSFARRTSPAAWAATSSRSSSRSHSSATPISCTGGCRSAVASRPLGEAGALNISAGVAELRPDDDSISFFQRADNALYGAKEAGKGQVVGGVDDPAAAEHADQHAADGRPAAGGDAGLEP